MRLLVWLFLCSLLVSEAALARKDDRPAPRPVRAVHAPGDLSPAQRAVHAGAAIDTFVIGHWTFDGSGGGPDAQGWTSRDGTIYENVDSFFHVTNALELDGGDFGRAVVLEGAQSMWCGVAAGTHPEVCGYATLPGYGNHWEQYLVSVDFVPMGDVTVSLLVSFDSEPAYEGTDLRFLHKDGYMWPVEGHAQGSAGLFTFDWLGMGFESFVMPESLMADTTRIDFAFWSDGAWSDQDGLWNTDGAIIIDSLAVVDATGTINFQNFESEPLGAKRTNDGWWTASRGEEYGDFAGLFPGLDVVQEDACVSNVTNLWGFFAGSTVDYACGGHPEQTAVPFHTEAPRFWQQRYIYNEVWSPPIDWDTDVNGQPIPPGAAQALLEFDVYRDLALENLVFYVWRVRSIFDGCVDHQWYDENFVYWGEEKDWFRHRSPIGGQVRPGADQLQVALGVRDMCAYWCGYYGTGTCHSHAPLFDNVRVSRIGLEGPAFWIDDLAYSVFSDNFATDGTITGTVRVDAGWRRSSVVPADSIVIWVNTPLGIDNHIPGDMNSGPAVYGHVKHVGPPPKANGPMSGGLDYPWVAFGAPGWSIFKMNGAAGSTYSSQKYRFDLNDDLFTPGDTISYYYSARDTAGNTTYWSVHTGTTNDESRVLAAPMEITCLPANALAGGTDILYVDNFDNRGAQPFFDSAFDALGITPDRYDVIPFRQGSESGPAARVTVVAVQLGMYKKIIWNSGTKDLGVIGDGTSDRGGSDDYAMLYEFLDTGPNGLYLSGDNLASTWLYTFTPAALDLRTDFMNFTLVSDDHFAAGEPVSPLIIAGDGSCFDHAGVPDTLVAWGGGCPGVNNFDVLGVSGDVTVEMTYSDLFFRGAVVSQATENAVGDTARVVLAGFSYHSIRDDRVQSPIDRVDHLRDILQWLGNDVDQPVTVGEKTARVNALAQNYPNPFNPSTAIRFQLREPGNATLRIYNVAGQLVRTLVDGFVPAGAVQVATWDGRNDAGMAAASGVYFYRITSRSFTRTRKMVLLK